MVDHLSSHPCWTDHAQLELSKIDTTLPLYGQNSSSVVELSWVCVYVKRYSSLGKLPKLPVPSEEKSNGIFIIEW